MHVALRFFQQQGDGGQGDERGAGDGQEEGLGADEGQHGEKGHGADVAVGAGHAGHLSGETALDQRHHGEHRAFARLHEEGTGHAGDHRQPYRPGRGDVAHEEIARGQSANENHQGLAAAEPVADQPAGGTGEQIHEGKPGSQQAGGDRGQFEGVHEEQGQHGDHCQFRAEGDEIGQVQNCHLLELVTFDLGHFFHEHVFVDLVDAHRLEGVDAQQQRVDHVGQRGGQNAEVGRAEFPGQDRQRRVHGDVHQQIEKEIALAGHFHGAGLLRLEVGRALGRVGHGKEIHHGIDQRQRAGSGKGITPAVIAAVEQGEGGQAHGRRGRTEVAPATVDALGHAQLSGREPFADHANADHETGAGEAHQKPHQQQLLVVVGEGETETEKGGNEQQQGIHAPRAEGVHQHADDDARRDGQGHVDDQQGLDLLIGQSEGFAHGRQQGRVVEPDEEAQKEGKPAQVQNADLATEGQQVEFFSGVGHVRVSRIISFHPCSNHHATM